MKSEKKSTRFSVNDLQFFSFLVKTIDVEKGIEKIFPNAQIEECLEKLKTDQFDLPIVEQLLVHLKKLNANQTSNEFIKKALSKGGRVLFDILRNSSNSLRKNVFKNEMEPSIHTLLIGWASLVLSYDKNDRELGATYNKGKKSFLSAIKYRYEPLISEALLSVSEELPENLVKNAFRYSRENLYQQHGPIFSGENDIDEALYWPIHYYLGKWTKEYVEECLGLIDLYSKKYTYLLDEEFVKIFYKSYQFKINPERLNKKFKKGIEQIHRHKVDNSKDYLIIEFVEKKISLPDQGIGLIYEHYRKEFDRRLRNNYTKSTLSDREEVFQESILIFLEKYVANGRVRIVGDYIVGLTVPLKEFLIKIGSYLLNQEPETNPFDQKYEYEFRGEPKIDHLELEKRISLKRKCLNELKENQQELLYQYLVEGRSSEEVARIFKYKNGGTVRVLVNRLKERLKNCLEEKLKKLGY